MIDVGFQLSEVDSNIVVFTFSVAMVLCIKRTLEWPGILLALAFTWLYQHIDVSFFVVRNYFPSENPETVTVVLFLLSVGGLFLHMLRRSTRTRDRLMMFLAISSMSVVTGLFHFVAIEQTLMTWQKTTNLINTQLLTRSDADFLEGCQERNLMCYTGKDVQGFSPEVDENLLATIRKTATDTAGQDAQSPLYLQFASLTGMYKKYFVVYFSTQGNQRLIIDEPSALLAHETSRKVFYYLATFAHGVWLIGVLFLIWLHRRIMARRP
jgi:hypothetical protein